MNDNEKHYTIGRAAELCGVCSSTLRYWVMAGHIPSSRYGKTLIITAEQLPAIKQRVSMMRQLKGDTKN